MGRASVASRVQGWNTQLMDYATAGYYSQTDDRHPVLAVAQPFLKPDAVEVVQKEQTGWGWGTEVIGSPLPLLRTVTSTEVAYPFFLLPAFATPAPQCFRGFPDQGTGPALRNPNRSANGLEEFCVRGGLLRRQASSSKGGTAGPPWFAAELQVETSEKRMWCVPSECKTFAETNGTADTTVGDTSFIFFVCFSTE
ncbi:unnamed protein product [Phytomonas sp. Hart1]|nr:unnamed protein product [Phytomonas sp. Hart1]|eukprot:CCW72027.1 unnamed protein product [Phytomonas sp. isolate Hart1]